MAQLIQLIKDVVPEAQIDFLDKKFPIPELLDSTALRKHFRNVYETPLSKGIEQTIFMFRKLVQTGQLPVNRKSH